MHRSRPKFGGIRRLPGLKIVGTRPYLVFPMPNLANLLENTLPSGVLEGLRLAGSLAAGGECDAQAAYLVGGSVRDTLVGLTPGDPDVAIVGDAPKFAMALVHHAGGVVKSVSQFGTARVVIPAGSFDLATARTETYEEPGALPNVEASGIVDDLSRRDFTINSMAVDISPSNWGELLDPHSGFSDTARRRIKVLHSDSFQDDPTRIFRAIRYQVRLDFNLDPGTLTLMKRDWSYMDRVSAARVRGELEKILIDPERADILAAAEDHDVLAGIDISFRVSRTALQTMRENPDRNVLFYLALSTASLTENEARSLVSRLEPPQEWRDIILSSPRYRGMSSILKNPNLSPSEVVSVLGEFPLPLLEAQREMTGSRYQQVRLDQYLETLRHVRPEVTGDDLLAAGVPQGPEVGIMLAEVLDARMDGLVSTKEEELEFVGRRLMSPTRHLLNR